jgi:L-rhamnose mutarotase
MENKKYLLMLDLKADEKLIAEYEQYHKHIWPEVRESIKFAGIENMEIYRWNNRLVMIMEVNDSFSFERKAAMDEYNPKVQEWEKLMWRFQQLLPNSKPGEKWQVMDKIFQI